MDWTAPDASGVVGHVTCSELPYILSVAPDAGICFDKCGKMVFEGFKCSVEFVFD